MNPHRRKDDLFNILCAGIVVFIFLYILILSYGCNQYVYQPVVETPCDAAYFHIQNMGCDDLLIIPGRDETENTSDDMDWIKWCIQIQTGGALELGLDCAMVQTTCLEIERCL